MPENSLEWIKRGRELLNSGKFERALSLYNGIIKMNPENKEIAEALRAKAEVFYIRNELSKALDVYEKTVPLYESLEDIPSLIDVLTSMGRICTLLENPKMALKAYKKAINIYESHFEPSEELFFLLYQIGDLYLEGDKYQKALKIYERILELRKKQGPLEGFAEDFFTSAQIYYNLKQYNKSTDYFRKALEIYRDSEDKSGKALTLLGLSKSLKSEKHFEDAYEMILQGIEILEQLATMEIPDTKILLNDAIKLKKSLEPLKN